MDVRTRVREDKMDSFVLAETLKCVICLYILFYFGIFVLILLLNRISRH
jgi:hypothetical protein